MRIWIWFMYVKYSHIPFCVSIQVSDHGILGVSRWQKWWAQCKTEAVGLHALFHILRTLALLLWYIIVSHSLWPAHRQTQLGCVSIDMGRYLLMEFGTIEGCRRPQRSWILSLAITCTGLKWWERMERAGQRDITVSREWGKAYSFCKYIQVSVWVFVFKQRKY